MAIVAVGIDNYKYRLIKKYEVTDGYLIFLYSKFNSSCLGSSPKRLNVMR